VEARLESLGRLLDKIGTEWGRLDRGETLPDHDAEALIGLGGSLVAGVGRAALGRAIRARAQIVGKTSQEILPTKNIGPRFPSDLEKQRTLVNEVLNGKKSLDSLTPQQRQQAADFYRELSGHTTGKHADAAARFNRLRADYLGGKTNEVPGNLTGPSGFIERHGP
jgi:hypothetical protein